MAELKTRENEGDVEAFLNGITHPQCKHDAWSVYRLLQKVTGLPGKMWRSSIVGFGRYHYHYDSGREGDYLRIGFSPRKQNLVVYIVPGFSKFQNDLERLGKHKSSVSCLNINKISDIDLTVLEGLMSRSFALMNANYPQ